MECGHSGVRYLDVVSVDTESGLGSFGLVGINWGAIANGTIGCMAQDDRVMIHILKGTPAGKNGPSCFSIVKGSSVRLYFLRLHRSRNV